MAYRPPLSERTPLMQTSEALDKHGSPPASPPLVWPSVMAALIAALGAFSFGFTLGYSSPATYQLKLADNTSLPVTHGRHMHLEDSTLSWFGVSLRSFFLIGFVDVLWLRKLEKEMD